MMGNDGRAKGRPYGETEMLCRRRGVDRNAGSRGGDAESLILHRHLFLLVQYMIHAAEGAGVERVDPARLVAHRGGDAVP